MPVITAGGPIGVWGVDVTATHTTQKHPLGMIVHCADGTTRKYIRAGAAIAQYDALTYDSEGIHDWQPTSAADTPVFGVAPVAIADNSFGWAIIKGKANVKVAATIVVGTIALVPTATAGTLDDTAATAANAGAMAAGVGVTGFLDDSPSAGIASVLLT